MERCHDETHYFVGYNNLQKINRTNFPCALETHVPLCKQPDITLLQKTKVGLGEENYLLKEPNPVTVNGRRVSCRGFCCVPTMCWALCENRDEMLNNTQIIPVCLERERVLSTRGLWRITAPPPPTPPLYLWSGWGTCSDFSLPS